MSTATAIPRFARYPKRTHVRDLIPALDRFCESLAVGERIPTRAELVQKFNASERAVLRALDELEREGKIVRRQGSGVFVAERKTTNDNGIVPQTITNQQTIVAIAKPDSSYYDHAMRLLFGYIENAGMSLACRFLDPATSTLTLPAEDAIKPRGYIVFRQDLLPLARQLQDAGNRVVLVGAPYVGTKPEVPNVYGDHQKGGYLAAQHLITLGHRHIAFCGTRDTLQTRRWKGYERAIADAQRKGLDIASSVLFLEEAEEWEQSSEKAREYFARADAPTGIAVWNDHEATGLLSSLTRARIRVPEDVSLVGYDDLPEGRRVHPPLTTVDSALEQQLQAALDILTDESPIARTHTVVVLPALVKRESCAPLQP
jgi:GntR family transcriptional regulator of arabinose operon